MKPDIHPKCREINVTCSCGHQFKVNSARSADFRIEVCDHCHPFYTGQKKILETRGRVEQYRLRYETPRATQMTRPAPVAKVPSKKVVKKVVGAKTTTKAKTVKKVQVKPSKMETKSKTTAQKAKKTKS
jgi:large subunit ribosomal protein L31